VQRRAFLEAAGTLTMGLTLDLSDGIAQKHRALSSQAATSFSKTKSGPVYVVLGVPLRTGSLYPGHENDAQAYREAGIIASLTAAGCNVLDGGDIPIPSYLPHHSVPPIRSWPGPRIVWEIVSEKVTEVLKQPQQIPFLIGCDCSVVVGTAKALQQASSQDIHVLYVDGDCDDAPPASGHCQSAAACAAWFLTNPSPFWAGSSLQPSQLSLVGFTRPSQAKQPGVHSFPLTEIHRLGPRAAASQMLAAIPPSAAILLHLDIDVFRSADLSAVYFPHAEGLTLAEGAELLEVLLHDNRVRIVEISEYASLRDQEQASVHKLIAMFAGNLQKATPQN
jgi:arginase